MLGGRRIGAKINHDLADLAAERGVGAAARPILEKLTSWLESKDRPHYASVDDFYRFGGALAALAPELAAVHFEPVWMRYLDYGPWQDGRNHPNLVAIGTGVLVPLLGSSAKETYLPIAKAYASWLGAEELRSPRYMKEWLRAARHLLRGFRLSGDAFARSLATRFVGFESAFDGPEPEEIRTEASRVLR